jgi:hypothetical protein
VAVSYGLPGVRAELATAGGRRARRAASLVPAAPHRSAIRASTATWAHACTVRPGVLARMLDGGAAAVQTPWRHRTGRPLPAVRVPLLAAPLLAALPAALAAQRAPTATPAQPPASRPEGGGVATADRRLARALLADRFPDRLPEDAWRALTHQPTAPAPSPAQVPRAMALGLVDAAGLAYAEGRLAHAVLAVETWLTAVGDDAVR